MIRMYDLPERCSGRWTSAHAHRTQMRFILCLLLAFQASIAAAQRLALTFDDGVDPARLPDAAKVNGDLLDALRHPGVSATLFPTLVHTGGAEGRALVGDWSEAGHMIGNHTSRHRNLDAGKLSLADFIGDVEEAEAAFRDLPTWTRLLRFPYLKEGNTNAAWLTDAVTALKQHGWSIPSSTAAFEDPIYRMSPDILPAAESIVWSLAKAAGVGDLRYPAEDSVYEEPKLRSLGLLP
jgi:peptidoglycan/xylan/chitin deacetylase (PgdA/CDA1 family)